VKDKIVAELERAGITVIPSKPYYTRCLERLLGSNFDIRLARSVEEDHDNVKLDDIERHFANHGQRETGRISPPLILNMNEINFGESKSGKQTWRRVL
jgi:hypothetical protein